MQKILPLVPLLFLGVTAHASDLQHSTPSKYAGQENRAIKSLSPDDILELRRGGGWGLAKVAELNGLPGPTHLLEMKDDIHFSKSQLVAITEVYDVMKARAVAQGEKYIALEMALERHFQERTITDEILRSSLEAISDARRELRYIHLAAHLKTPKILSDDQVKAYNARRGYAKAEPCSAAPKGHDLKMWREHNGCK